MLKGYGNIMVAVTFVIAALIFFVPISVRAGLVTQNGAEDHILVGILYLSNGRAFGQTDFGLRAPYGFCERQRSATESGWKAKGIKIVGQDVFYFEDRKYFVKLFCISALKFNETIFRAEVVNLSH